MNGPARVRGSRPLRRGVWVFPSAPARQLVAAAVAADRAGIDEFWIGDEGPARDPFAVLAAAASQTARVRLGVAVTNPYLRHPVALAAQAMTIDELSDGRMTLGLGPGGSVALGPAGVSRTRPLATVRDALATVRAVATGTAASGYHPPSQPFTRPGLRLVVGSRGRAFQELASREADGVFLGGVPEPLIAPTIGWARSVRPIDVGLYGTAVLDEAEVDRVRPSLVMPLADSPPHVHEALDLDGEALRRAATALAAGDPGPARRLVDDRVFEAMVLHGSPTTVGRRLAARVREHDVDAIGLTFTTSDPVQVVQDSALAFAAMDEELAR